MTAEDKKKVLAVLDELMEGTSGVVRATILACKFAIDEMEVEEKWIPVAERLPEESGCYIVTACDEDCAAGESIWYDTVVVYAEYFRGCWSWYEGQTEYDITGLVTHWIPMPEPPKEGAK